MKQYVDHAQDDGQSSQSNPAFYTPAYYPLSRTFFPAFSIPPFTRCHSRIPHSRFLADRTNGRAIATLLRLSSSVVVVCDVMYCG